VMGRCAIQIVMVRLHTEEGNALFYCGQRRNAGW
jgi:hypothetical protein